MRCLKHTLITMKNKKDTLTKTSIKIKKCADGTDTNINTHDRLSDHLFLNQGLLESLPRKNTISFAHCPNCPPTRNLGCFFTFEKVWTSIWARGVAPCTQIWATFSFLVSKSIWVPTAPPPRPIWALPKRKGVFSRKASPWGTLTRSQKIQCVMSCPFLSILQLYNDDDNDDFTRVGCLNSGAQSQHPLAVHRNVHRALLQTPHPGLRPSSQCKADDCDLKRTNPCGWSVHRRLLVLELECTSRELQAIFD